ncbi:uncharacterized protein LOC111614938 isoform X2 [Centruroides sculpturatus]|uniref:uncharacterized protein LOC111614938 isoform X2 n=1 Tax=Centruroides sculpturatus TaxID=218467 RepID=UPI000C6D873B|nr:uncharacterized protein LOC111614938 isoform X2 [Centruroides sculpturatus]
MEQFLRDAPDTSHLGASFLLRRRTRRQAKDNFLQKEIRKSSHRNNRSWNIHDYQEKHSQDNSGDVFQFYKSTECQKSDECLR